MCGIKVSVSTVDSSYFKSYLTGMDTKHPHAEAIDRIGATAITSHFNISRQALWKWRKNGVPRIHHNSLRMLAMVRGVNAPELNQGEQA